MIIESSYVRRYVDSWFSGTLEAPKSDEYGAARPFDKSARAAVTIPAIPFAIVEAAIRAIGALFLAIPAAVASFIKNDSAKAFVSFYQRQFIDALGDAVSIPLFSLVWRSTQFAPSEYNVTSYGEGGFVTMALSQQQLAKQAFERDANPFAAHNR